MTVKNEHEKEIYMTKTPSSINHHINIPANPIANPSTKSDKLELLRGAALPLASDPDPAVCVATLPQ
jgi:hypothetical protein